MTSKSKVPHPRELGTPACAGADVNQFFPPGNVAITPAIYICDRCPLKKPCLEYALEHKVHGIWGGTTTDERQKIRRRLQRRGRPVQAGLRARPS